MVVFATPPFLVGYCDDFTSGHFERGDILKRYRVVTFSFDTRSSFLGLNIGEDKKLPIRNGLEFEYGQFNKNQKEKNFIELGDMPFSILAFHNNFFYQCRIAFIMGAYYPALTGTCALGERILNHLILLLREDYRATPDYKFARKDTFDNWTTAINILSNWGVLTKEVETDFKSLSAIRNNSIHFQPEIDMNDRPVALKAMKIMQRIISNQFSAFGSQPWFITGVPGEIYIKKEWEAKPFIKRVYLPNCVLVGPHHFIETNDGINYINDNFEYEQKEISDNEFVALRTKK